MGNKSKEELKIDLSTSDVWTLEDAHKTTIPLKEIPFNTTCTQNLDPRDKVSLILAKVEILKLKANDHDWQCYIPDKVKAQLEQTLLEIEALLEGQ